jgi:tetratricopeptide (TPR) repeat protein
MHYWHEIFPGEILELNYEDVVDDLEGSARKMLDYIGVDWEPEVLKFNELDRTVKTASVWQVRQPIYKSSKAKWKRYESHLAPLIKGTNAKIEFDPIDDMITLPEPGLLQQGVEHYRNSELREAETCFKKLLHHNPDHAAANYMVGLVYCSIGEIKEAIPLIEKALDKCPWHKDWRKNLARAYSETGQEDKVDALKLNQKDKEIIEEIPEDNEWPDLNDERIFDGL